MGTIDYSKQKSTSAQALAFTMLSLAASHALATEYSFSDLGTVAVSATAPIYASGINNQGHIVALHGTSSGFANGQVYATVWNGSSWVDQPSISGSHDHEFAAINDHDQIAGTVSFAPAQDLYKAYRYDNGVPVELPTYTATSWFQRGNAINNNGQIIGDAFDTQWESVIWNADGSLIVLPSYGLGSGNSAINDAGVAVGTASDAEGNFDQAVYWDAASHDIHTLIGKDGSAGGPGWAADINNLGQIVGTVNSPELVGVTTGQAVIWNSVNDAPELLPLSMSGFHGLVANDINDLGQMVGWAINDDPNGNGRIFLWDHGTMTDLSALLPAVLAGDGWRLAAYMPHINNLGQVAGYMVNDDDGRLASYMLTPTAVPVPGAVWLFGSALFGMVGLRRRG
ncbi:hypothetical protein [Methylomonas sp. UP202]|uniref:hypothetical protein n=1 Tax=Methylomonas sp. UP202 TaxID=3040943 RepID=UPI00247A7FDF|nr:hypothetical protein [Methylomonas sp. UP202]WGS85761.1 hypothetical protein QC632_22425 [Methylomonas sp. UP202]